MKVYFNSGQFLSTDKFIFSVCRMVETLIFELWPIDHALALPAFNFFFKYIFLSRLLSCLYSLFSPYFPFSSLANHLMTVMGVLDPGSATSALEVTVNLTTEPPVFPSFIPSTFRDLQQVIFSMAAVVSPFPPSKYHACAASLTNGLN